MRVLMLSKALVVGAYQTKLEEIARQPDIELIVAVPPYWREGKQRIVLERLHTQGYELVTLDMALNGHYHLHVYPALAGLVRRVRPHVFHIDEEPYNLATWHALRVGQRAGARCLFFTWQNLYRAQTWNLAQRYVLSHADGAIAGNADAAAILRRRGFTRPLVVIPQFGVDPAIYRPLPDARAQRSALLPGVTDSTFVIGYLGRLVEQKGLLGLVRAAAPLEGDWRLVLVGGGDLTPAIRTLARQIGVGERVNLAPPVPSGAVPRWLNAFDCLALPSLTRPNWKEQFGRVLVEAMACCVPVIGSDSGEIPNVIGDAGLIFPEGDEQALRAGLARLQADAALRRRLGEAGRARVLARYTQASVAAATCAFYRQLV